VVKYSLLAPPEALGVDSSLEAQQRDRQRHFWFVFKTATLAFILEEAAVYTGASTGLLVTGSDHGEID
jgi:hypothetical protein